MSCLALRHMHVPSRCIVSYWASPLGDYSYCLGVSEIHHRSYDFLQVDQPGSLEKTMMSSDVVRHDATILQTDRPHESSKGER